LRPRSRSNLSRDPVDFDLCTGALVEVMIALSILSGTPTVAVDPRALLSTRSYAFFGGLRACVEVLPLREGQEARTLDMMMASSVPCLG
jgi:hypothetical protein